MLCLDVPPGTEVGIDYVAWQTGRDFAGIKMIPAGAYLTSTMMHLRTLTITTPGIHFFYFSARSKLGDMAARSGFFLRMKPGQVDVLRWDAASESFLRQRDLDADLDAQLSAGTANTHAYTHTYSPPPLPA